MNTSGQFDDDTTTMIILGILFGPAVLAAGLGVVASKIPTVASWLTDHHVLVAASDNPILVIPETGGAGLDLSRILPITALLLIALVWTAWIARHREGTDKKEARTP